MVIRFAWHSHTMSIIHRNSQIKQGTAQVSPLANFLLVGWLAGSFVCSFVRWGRRKALSVLDAQINETEKQRRTRQMRWKSRSQSYCTALRCTVLYCTDFGRTVRRVVLSAMGGGTYKWRTVVWVTDRHVCMKRRLPRDKFWQCHVWGRSGVHLPKS